MNKQFVTSSKASKILGVHSNTLRIWESKSIIESFRSPGGKRQYNVEDFVKKQSNQSGPPKENICYCRVSSQGQKEDLKRQVDFLKERYPGYAIVTDIGSGLNYKRKGLQTILDKAMSRTIGQIVVTYKDRLCRFGFDLVEWIVTQSGGTILVLNDDKGSPREEMVKDLTSIIHVFSCRLYGLRKYKKQIQEDKEIGTKEEKVLGMS